MEPKQENRDVVADAEPPVKERSKLITVCPYILGNEFCERLAYYGLATNLVSYFKELGASSASAASATSAFSGFCYLFPLLGGWIADAHWGRFKTILIFSIIYLIGMLTLTGSAAIPGIRVEDNKDANGGQWLLLALALFLVAAGTGGIKPNVSSFGADQFDERIPSERKEKQSFFNWFYFFINVGALIASTVIVYIQDQDLWGIGFGIPSAALFVAVVSFLVGKPLYRFEMPMESPIARFIKVTRAALRNRRRGKEQVADRSEPSDRSAPLITTTSNTKKEHWLDWAIGPADFTERQVYEIKLVYGVFLIFFTSVFYWMVYMQMFGLFILQGDQLDRKISIFGLDTKIPAASMSLFNTASIILLIPLYDLLLLPALKRTFNYEPTMLQRSGAGYVLAMAAMLAAYTIEKKRLDLYKQGDFHIHMDDDDEVEVVNLSIWWQTIPYSLIGASEVAASIGLMEFFYDQAPDTMRSMMSSLQLLTVSLGGYASSLLLYIVNQISEAAGSKWITDNLNEGHLDYFFLVIAGIMLLTFFWYLYVAAVYKYKQVSHAEEGDVVDEQRLIENLGRSVAYHGEEPEPVERL